jgi:hypothetical protein
VRVCSCSDPRHDTQHTHSLTHSLFCSGPRHDTHSLTNTQTNTHAHTHTHTLTHSFAVTRAKSNENKSLETSIAARAELKGAQDIFAKQKETIDRDVGGGCVCVCVHLCVGVCVCA